MKQTYNIFIDYEEDTLNIIKVPSKSPVSTVEGKYGIEVNQDINGKTVGIVIPEPDILFGVDIDILESFLISDFL